VLGEEGPLITPDDGYSLPRYWPWFIALPLGAFMLSNLVLAFWAPASYELAQPLLPDGHAEASGRLRVLATFVLFVAFATASVIYFGLVLHKLGRQCLKNLRLAYLITLGIGAMTMFALGLHKGDAYFENNFACASLERLRPPPDFADADASKPLPASGELAGVKVGAAKAPTPSATPGPASDQPAAPKPKAENAVSSETAPGLEASTTKPPARVALSTLKCPLDLKTWTGLPRYRDKDQNYFRNSRILAYISALVFLLATPALVWGAVACLALPDNGSRTEVYAAWVRQTERLNQLLYLTAAFLIVGLFFASARLNWPAFSLHPADLAAYSGHSRSYVFYLGVINSVLIASYYLPVAAVLARRRPPRPIPASAIARGVQQPDGGEKPDPFRAYKVALTILSPAILGLLGELLKFTP
jgi:hypothetical protein